MTGPRWIKQWINNLAALNELFRDDDGKVDFEALGREEYQFRQALVTHKFAKSERAKEAYQQAMTAYSANVENGKKGGRPKKKSPQDAPNGNAGVDMHDAGNGAASKSPTSCDQFTADAPAREDGEFHDNLESATSANNSGNGGSGTSQARESRRGADSLRSDCHSAPVRLPSFDEFTQFIDAQGLDYTDAREWWEMTMVDRDGHDRDGKPIRNWKITCRRFCEAKANKRKTAK
ncbi:MAG: hypothetical protein IKO55_17305 [Kiritimatiellae bacterium]|uniref:hypothetical protein n=1 Tax=Fibrobacter sp. TaxID=35828 RepID=UPI0025B9DE86|nr:hypothetical protein [Fibrobacter sp.]MBR4009096.1 hypothetical protein [Fibrobacter sp.]MBR4617370.1 hypothetical protein [Kiritimatiellia bacterium]